MGQVARRRRRRWPFVLLGIVAVLLAVLVVLDFVAKDASQNAIASAVKRSTHSDGASASISSFPFIYDLASAGRVDRVVVTDHGVPVGPVRLAQIRLDASKVTLDRQMLWNSSKIRITGVDRADLSVVVQLSGFESSVASSIGLAVEGTASNHIVITAAGRTLATLDLTKIPIIPYCAVQVTHTGPTYELSCTVSPVPAGVIAALDRQVTRP